MGAGFWVIQGIFALAAIGTAVHAEHELRENEEGAAPVRVPIERGPGAPRFTSLEQARLTVLRRFVQEARAYQGALYDDLAPESAQDFATPPEPRRPWDKWPWRKILLAAGIALLLVGAIGGWGTSSQMDELAAAGRSVHPSLMSRLLPGMISNPAKYLSAVNSSTAGAVGSGQDPFQAVAMLTLKQALDRCEALFGFGLALVLATAMRSRAEGQPGAAAHEQSSIGSDVVPFIAVAAMLCGALSFFDLP